MSKRKTWSPRAEIPTEKPSGVAVTYIGLQDSIKDPVTNTDLVWLKGQTHYVSPEMAALLARHPLVFSVDETVDLPDYRQIKPVTLPDMENDFVNLVNLESLKVDELKAYSMREFGLRIDGTKKEIIAALNKRIGGQLYRI